MSILHIEPICDAVIVLCKRPKSVDVIFFPFVAPLGLVPKYLEQVSIGIAYTEVFDDEAF